MVLRETTFLIGGILTIGLGVALGVGLYVAGAGFEYYPAWLAAALAVGFGVFFIYVSVDEARERRRFLASTEGNPAAGRNGPPP